MYCYLPLHLLRFVAMMFPVNLRRHCHPQTASTGRVAVVAPDFEKHHFLHWKGFRRLYFFHLRRSALKPLLSPDGYCWKQVTGTSYIKSNCPAYHRLIILLQYTFAGPDDWEEICRRPFPGRKVPARSSRSGNVRSLQYTRMSYLPYSGSVKYQCVWRHFQNRAQTGQ